MRVSARAPLKRVAYINSDTLPETTPESEELNYIDIGAVGRGLLMEKPTRVSFGEAPTRARRRVKAGDTIVSTVRTYLRAILPVGQEIDDSVVSTGFAVVRPGNAVDSGFLAWALQSDPFVEEVVARSVGVSYPAISPANIGSIPIPLWPTHTQKVVADFLDQEISRIDGLVERKRRLIDLLEEKQRAETIRLVTAGLDPDPAMKSSNLGWLDRLPAHWSERRLGQICQIVGGTGFPQLHQGQPSGALPFYKVSDMNRGGNEIWLHDAANYVSPETARLLGGSIVPTEAIVFPKVGAALLTNKRRLVSRPCLIDNNCMALVFRAGVPAYWHLLLSIIDLSEIAQQGPVPSVNGSQVKSIRVPVPPEEEQASILEYSEVRSSKTRIAVQKLESQLSLISEYRQALITAAVTGDLDISRFDADEGLEVALS